MSSLTMDIITKLSSPAEPSLPGDENELDPADYLFKETKYHDWLVTVGDPASDKTTVEKFGVVSSFLLSQSVFFRKMVAGSKLVDTKNLNITNVSPAVFRLVLRYVYGGKLPDIDRSTAAQLALTANSYKMAGLATETCKRLIPTCVEEVFPALWCVSYVHCPDLEPHVVKIVQEDTKCLTERKEFLDLDSKCVEFIAKQDKLGINELALWKALVKWAQFKALTSSEKSARGHLENTLQFLRLTTLSQDEIVKEVIPSKVLQANEVLELLEAVNHNEPWSLTGLCKTQTVRQMSEIPERGNQPTNGTGGEPTTNLTDCKTFDQLRIFCTSYALNETPDYQSISNLTIKTFKDLEITSFVFESKSLSKLGNQPVYTLACTITFYKIIDGFCKEKSIVQVGGSVVGSSEVTFPLKFRNGGSVILEANTWYNVALEFSTAHPSFALGYTPGTQPSKPAFVLTTAPQKQEMQIRYDTPLHVKMIHFKVESDKVVQT